MNSNLNPFNSPHFFHFSGIMSTHHVKLREGKSNENKEILVSSTVVKKVFYSRSSLIISDVLEDPMLGKAASIKHAQIRSVICVPLIAHDRVHGIFHLDSRDKINSFSKKDLALVKAISNQTAIALENHMLIKEVETNARITEQLGRFLAPHIVDRMVNKSEVIRKGFSFIMSIPFIDNTIRFFITVILTMIDSCLNRWKNLGWNR